VLPLEQKNMMTEDGEMNEEPDTRPRKGAIHTDHGDDLVIFRHPLLKQHSFWCKDKQLGTHIRRDGCLVLTYVDQKDPEHQATEQLLNLENEILHRDKDKVAVKLDIDRLVQQLGSNHEDDPEVLHELHEDLSRYLAVQRNHNQRLQALRQVYKVDVLCQPVRITQILEPHMLTRFSLTKELIFWCPNCNKHQCPMQRINDPVPVNIQETKLPEQHQTFYASTLNSDHKDFYLSLESQYQDFAPVTNENTTCIKHYMEYKDPYLKGVCYLNGNLGACPNPRRALELFEQSEHPDAYFQRHLASGNLELLQEAAWRGHGEAAYRWHKVWPLSSTSRLRWLKRAAEVGSSPDASYDYGLLTNEFKFFLQGLAYKHIGCMYQVGQYYLQQGKYQDGIQMLENARLNGSAEACLLLGKAYLNDEVNRASARDCLMEASTKYGCAEATFLWGQLDSNLELLKLSLEQGHKEAMPSILRKLPIAEVPQWLEEYKELKDPMVTTLHGICSLLDGDTRSALHAFQTSGSIEARYHLAGMYRIGIGLPFPDTKRATQLLESLTELGDAQFQLAQQQVQQGNYGLAKNYLLACVADHVTWLNRDFDNPSYLPPLEYISVSRQSEAWFTLGRSILIGLMEPTMEYSARSCLDKAVKAGYLPAILQLAECYETGWGLNQSKDEAMNLYWIAAEMGDKTAHLSMTRLVADTNPSSEAETSSD